MKHTLLFVIAISLFGYLTAQNNSWAVHLSGHTVTSLALEDDYIWAATDSFLVRLNKSDKSTNCYPYPDILAHTTCNLKIDGNGVKWIVCSSRPGPEVENKDIITNMYRFDGENWVKVDYNEPKPISSLAIDKNDIVWITSEARLYKLEQGVFKRITTENSQLVFDKVSQVTSDKDGNIWLSNYGNFGDLATADLILIKMEGDKWTSHWSDSRLICFTICIDNEGSPWVQQFRGIRKLDVNRSIWTTELMLSLDNPLVLFAVERENKYWFNGGDNGITGYDGVDWNYYTKSTSALPSDRVYQVVVDTDNTKWIATGEGLAAFNENGLKTSVRRDQKLLDETVLYPNPAHDFITLRMPKETQNSTVDIININGQVIKSFRINNNQSQLNVSTFPAGIYLLRIQSEENQILKKFVKQ